MSDVTFVKFVRAVKGRLVPHWGASGYFGAKLASPDAQANGAEAVTWDENRVYGITEDVYRSHVREIDQAIALGDLKVASRADHDAFVKAKKEAREKRAKAKEAEAKAAAKAKADAEAESAKSGKGNQS